MIYAEYLQTGSLINRDSIVPDFLINSKIIDMNKHIL